MKLRHLFLGTAAAATILALGAFGWKVGHHAAWAHGAKTGYERTHSGGSHGGVHGFGRFCESESGKHFDALASYFKSELDLSDTQIAAWNRLEAAWQDGEATLQKACAEVAETGHGAEHALFQAETILTAGLDAVRGVRPTFNAFNATLSPAQKTRLDEILARHHRNH